MAIFRCYTGKMAMGAVHYIVEALDDEDARAKYVARLGEEPNEVVRVLLTDGVEFEPFEG